jgi:hypothetical protein
LTDEAQHGEDVEKRAAARTMNMVRKLLKILCAIRNPSGCFS